MNRAEGELTNTLKNNIMSKNLYVILFVFTLVVQGNYAQFSNKTMSVGGVTRSYRQYLPTAFNPGTELGLPLIIAMHGLGDNMTNFSNVGFDNIADTARFIVVFPQGTLSSLTSQTSWNNGTLLSSTEDDIGFLSMLIDTMKVKYNIDFSKVYFTGFSMGGIMTYHMLCALPSRIAAIASVSGPMSDSDISGCNPGRAVPVMHMHGTADGTVPYDSAALPSLSLVPATMAFWENNNGCADSTVYNLPDIASDGITVDTIPSNTCNAPVILWRENGADHQWLYTPLNDVDATTQIWLFFRDKIHPGPSQLGIESSNSIDDISILQVSSAVEIKSFHPIQELGIYDLQGRKLMELNVNNQSEVMIDMIDVASQVIIIKIMSNGNLKVKKWMYLQ